MMFFDAHLDLSMNAMEWNRDLRWSVKEIRASERGMKDKPDRGRGTVSFSEMRKGNVGICVATQIARYVKRSSNLPGWHSPEQAWAQTQGQLSWYRAMELAGEMRMIRNTAELHAHLKIWESGKSKAIGYILSLEGADSILSMEHLEMAFDQGLRAVGPAHYGPGTYAQGTDAKGGIGKAGRELLSKMESLGIILDATHLCDDSFWEAMDYYHGPVWASHNNCRAIVNHHRQFSDKQLKELISRGAVIGAVFDTWMLVEGWKRGVSTPQSTGVSLKDVVDHIDHVCQLAGNSLHAGIGTDLDGAFGKEQSPKDVDTIADLQKLIPLFEQRGYKQTDIENITSQNWIRFLENTWV